MLKTVWLLIEHFKLGLIGFVIVVAILFTIYSNRIYMPQNVDSPIETVCLENGLDAVSC